MNDKQIEKQTRTLVHHCRLRIQCLDKICVEEYKDFREYLTSFMEKSILFTSHIRNNYNSPWLSKKIDKSNFYFYLKLATDERDIRKRKRRNPENIHTGLYLYQDSDDSVSLHIDFVYRNSNYDLLKYAKLSTTLLKLLYTEPEISISFELKTHKNWSCGSVSEHISSCLEMIKK